MIAAGGATSGLPLWAVCAIAFVAILGLGLVALLGPLAKKSRDAKKSRLDEVYRYRVLGAYADSETAPATEKPVQGAIAARALAVIDKLVRARGQREKLLDDLERAGLRMQPEEWAAIQLLTVVGLLALGGVVLGPVGLIIGAVVGWLAPRLWIRLKISRRKAAFEAQLPDALQLLGGALRTGFALNQAISTVVREGLDPLSTEFGRVLQEVRLGANLEDALDKLADRMSSYDMQLVVMAIRTAREVGGNLAEVLQTTVATMRERVQLRGEVQTLTAEGRFSAKVLVALPIVMALFLFLAKREYLAPLYTTATGIAMLVTGVVLLVVGSVWLNRLTKIEV